MTKGGEGVSQMLTIVIQKLTIADERARGGWGYNFVSQTGFYQPKICEKETIYVNLVIQCKAKTKHRPKSLFSVH